MMIISNQDAAKGIFSSLLNTDVQFLSHRLTDMSNSKDTFIYSVKTLFDRIYKLIGLNFQLAITQTESKTYENSFCESETNQQLDFNNGFDIFIKGINREQNFYLFCYPNDTVSSLKKIIGERLSILAEEIRLIHDGKHLNDGKRLAEYQVSKDSTLYLLPRMRGGKSQERLIKVNMYNGKNIELKPNKSINQTSIGYIKSLIKSNVGIEPENQCLIYDSKELTNDEINIDDIIPKDDDKIYVLKKENTGSISILGGEILDPRFDYDFTNVKDTQRKFKRGSFMYKRPCGWKRIALKVVDKYEDNTWLGSINCKGEWPVAYHGTNLSGAHGICFEGFNLSRSKRELYGRAHYTTPDIDIAEKYAQITKVNGVAIKFVVQSRVNPKNMVIRNDGLYWLLPDDKDLRPYGLCYKILK